KPFRSINRHVNPVLGWGWIIATIMANMVWAMPQFSLGTAALQQNLAPELLAGDGGKYACVIALFVIASIIIWFYDAGGWGMKLFDIILKLMVATVVISFFGVVFKMTTTGGLPWGEIFAGFVPDFSLFNEPADKFKDALANTQHAEYWGAKILGTQRDIMITSAATAVGINMTFLLPYSMLKKGWDKNFRGLASFDLSTGLFIPFLLATSCVVIASATQFHGQYDAALLGQGEPTANTALLRGGYESNLNAFAASLAPDTWEGLDDDAKEATLQGLAESDKQIAAMLVTRDAFVLANSLENLTGKGVAQYVFGIGVLGMAISTIIILMLINGFAICELIGVESKGAPHFFGCFLAGVSGALGFIFLWGNSEARFWLAVPTSVFGMCLLPIAYVTFFFMMNNKGLLRDALMQGGKRVAMNVAMLAAIVAASVGAVYSIWSKLQVKGIGILVAFIVLALIVHFARGKKSEASAE
ncbi:MAG: divalent metal cation transporter, partial [Planctomycetota bacterium]